MILRVLVPILSVLIAGTLPLLHNSINVYMMGFFRDIARVKARNRRMGHNAVVSMSDIKKIIFDEEDDDPLKDVVDKIMSSDGINDQFQLGGKDKDVDGNGNEDMNMAHQDDTHTHTHTHTQLPVYTREELYEFGNGENGIILLSLFGRIYDVSAGEKHYGKEGKYKLFAGRDVTRALSTGCLRETCLGSMKSDDDSNDPNANFEFNEKTMKEAKKWVAFFEVHDKYSHVGFLKDGSSIEHLIDSMVEEETASMAANTE